MQTRCGKLIEKLDEADKIKHSNVSKGTLKKLVVLSKLTRKVYEQGKNSGYYIIEEKATAVDSVVNSVIDDLKKELNISESELLDEAVDVGSVIKSLIDTDFSKDDESKGKASQMIKGLFYSKEDEAVKLIEKMDKWFSTLGK